MRLVTTADLNIRSGPSMVFEVVDRVPKGTELSSFEYRKDSEKIGWYHVNKGWVCAKYVSLATDIKSTNPNESPMDLKKNLVDVSTIGDSINRGSGISRTNSDNVMRSIFNAGSAEGEEKINESILRKRAFGLPYQFRSSVDMRGEGGHLGLDYMYTMGQAPYVSVVPGKPLFLPDLSDTEREVFFGIFNDLLAPLEDDVHILKAKKEALDSKNVELKYFGFELDYLNYVAYVNTLCWMFAIMLGIGEEVVPGTENLNMGSSDHPLNKFSTYNWAYYRLEQTFAHTNEYGAKDSIYFNNEDPAESVSNTGSGAWDRYMEKRDAGEGVFDSSKSALAYMLDRMDKEPFYTDFYINPNVSYSESFTNSTSPSMLEGLMNQASDYAKEIGFLLSSGVSASSESQQKLHDVIKNMSGNVTGGNGVISRMLSGVSTIISGANIAFPEIWKSSDYSRSYNIDITLKTPYGNKKSIFLDILVPMAHWICLAAPRMQTVNTYAAPFLVKTFIPGFCAIDMGIVENLTITKGGDGSAWSADGLPLEVNLSVGIKDLYSQLSIERINAVSPTDIWNFVWNTNLLDYMMVQSGLNMRQAECGVKLEILKALSVDKIDSQYIYNAVVDQIKSWFAESSKVVPFMHGSIFQR